MGKGASASEMCLPEWLLARTAMSEERTLRIPANIGSEQSELNLAIQCEFPSALPASLIRRNFLKYRS
jgi:hypothetical protein